MRVKICLVGDRGVGKTSLIQRYVAGRFRPDERGTLGAHLYPVAVDVPIGDKELVKARVALFDFMGEHAMRDNFRDAIFYGAHGGLAVCDVGRILSLYSLVDWIHAFIDVAGDVPLSVLLNKADLTQSMNIGMREMQWLREQFPLVPASLTSALTGQGVEYAFSDIITRTVDSLLGIKEQAQLNQILRHRLLSAIALREAKGMSKGELIELFKTTEPRVVMEELDNLVELGLLQQDESGPKGFVSTESIPVTFHFTITPAGRKVLSEPEGQELVVDDLG